VLHGRDIICISSVDWDFVWQGHQEIMTALATHGNRVLFIENTGVRTPTLRDLPRLWQRLCNWWRGIKGFRQERENLFVYSPLILPFPYSRLARWINRGLLLRALRQWMQATRFSRPVIWTFLPTRLVVDLIDRIDHDVVVYYCIADFEQLSCRFRKIAKSERMLLDRSDLVFVQGEVLGQQCAPHPNIHIFPFGVDMATFRRELNPAPELRSLKTPIIGYVGGVHRHLDLNLIERIALGVEGTVVLVGPIQTNVGRLKALDNVVFVGQQPHTRVADFVRGFDVGIIPYALTQYTRTVYPTKLNEYLAMGVPVVATDLPELRRFHTQHGEVVTLPRDAEGFVAAICEAIGKNSPGEIERRIEIARQNSWEVRIARMSELIEKALVARRAAGEGWERSLRRLYWSVRRRIAWTFGVLVVAYLLLFYSSVLWHIAEPLRIEQPPQQADAIAVFGGGVGEAGRPGESTVERARFGANLYLGGFAPYVVFSSGYAYKSNDAEDMKLIAVSMGLRNESIILEQKANSAYENVRYVAQIAREKGWRSLLVVSSPYNMRRVQLVFDKWGNGLRVTYTPVPGPKFYDPNLGSRWAQFRAIIHEYLGILYYWWNGWI
jgi:uncharacterized SAM-binding protein YcdF (DUF218 family)/glycosyltransferase involved in cell wall biosynthesis